MDVGGRYDGKQHELEGGLQIDSCHSLESDQLHKILQSVTGVVGNIPGVLSALRRRLLDDQRDTKGKAKERSGQVGQ